MSSKGGRAAYGRGGEFEDFGNQSRGDDLIRIVPILVLGQDRRLPQFERRHGESRVIYTRFRTRCFAMVWSVLREHKIAAAMEMFMPNLDAACLCSFSAPPPGPDMAPVSIGDR